MADIIEILDLSDSRLDVFARLTEAQLLSRRTPEEGLFIAESLKVIEHALDAGYEPVSFLMSRRHILGQARDIISRLDGVPVYTADEDALEGLTGFRLTRGILCAMRRPLLPEPRDICSEARRVAVLEGLSDPTNVGAVFRSAAALNIDAVLLTPTCCDPLNRRAVRVSMGTVFQVPWARTGPDWPAGCVERLRSMGFKTAALALGESSVSIEEPALAAEKRLAIVLGAEGDGLAAATTAQCDYTVRIPMSHGVDSLNVAAAGAVAFWQLRPRA